MKRNLEKELQKISKLPIGFDQDKGDYGKFYFNDLYELFSKTLDDVIGEDEEIPKKPKDDAHWTDEDVRLYWVFIARNDLRDQERARKKELFK